MKRARDSLTGGTKDVSPQWLSFATLQTAADTTTTISQAIPRQFLQQGQKMVQVMEVLKVIFDFPSFNAIASAAESSDSMSIMLSTTSFLTTGVSWSEPRVFAGWRVARLGAFTAAGSYGYAEPRMVVVDTSDGAGHGILIATDNIFSQVVSAGTGQANNVSTKIMYRWKNIPIEEFVGLVQSQQ